MFSSFAYILCDGCDAQIRPYDSSKSANLSLWFFTEPLLYLCVPANDSNLSETVGHIFAAFSKSILKVLGIYCLKIHNWYGFFILVKRYYAFLHLKPKLRGQFYFNEFETLFYIRTLECLNVWHTSPIHVSCVHLLL